ncbi:NAD(P)H-dependent flavin oxidoreductase [Aeromicrobium piscarium]|uniref:Nitronate monooxygenase n=1 Tax=Aeromicrobium piscarium TaxID=2590901 RepID=A0A554S7P6_9ACTN|nr:nitronate monooxygenase [Aeromicrobium piscarium]TSD62380.1 nitronate monooxygenase [Aeromicrobium piscarium]
MTYASTERLTALLGTRHPIIQDGMGPFRTNAIAIAVSKAGGLGTVSIPGMTKPPVEGKATMKDFLLEVATEHTGPFAVNVPVGRDAEGRVLSSTEAYISALIESREESDAVRTAVTTIITSAGFPGEFREAIKASGVTHIHKVGSTRHAIKAEQAGVDAVIASGYEMGGHTHAHPVHTFVLAPNVTEAVSIPVIVSGGVRDGRTMAAALALGASGVAMGTRFIATEENVDWHPAYAREVLAMTEGGDTTFPAIYGPARGLANEGVRELLEIVAEDRMTGDELSRWKDARIISAQETGDTVRGIMPMGQVASGIHSIVSIGTFIEEMAAEARRILGA